MSNCKCTPSALIDIHDMLQLQHNEKERNNFPQNISLFIYYAASALACIHGLASNMSSPAPQALGSMKANAGHLQCCDPIPVTCTVKRQIATSSLPFCKGPQLLIFPHKSLRVCHKLIYVMPSHQAVATTTTTTTCCYCWNPT